MVILFKLYLRGFLTLLFFISILGLDAESKRAEGIENFALLYEMLGEKFISPSTPKYKGIFRKKNIFPIQDAKGCSLVETEKFESVGYFGIQCNGSLRKGLIRFTDTRPSKHLPKGYFRLVGTHHIGNKKYIEIIANFDQTKIEANHSRKEETEFSYDEKNRSMKPKVIKKTNIIGNPNLTYFKTIAYDKNRSKESPNGLEIFFDHTCPLIFREVDYSFYWDNTVSYVFELSCVKETPYAIVRVPGNAQGNLPISEHIGKIPSRGDKFLAKLRMRKITNEQAFWENYKLYYE